MAAERAEVMVYGDKDESWQYPAAVAEALGWGDSSFCVAPAPED
jgi:hypothetical protein